LYFIISQRLFYSWADDPVCKLSAQDRKLPMTNDKDGILT